MSDYRFQVVEHNGIPCLHVMVDAGDISLVEMPIAHTYIPIDDIQAAIHRLEVAPGLIEFPPDNGREHTSDEHDVESVLSGLATYYYKRAKKCNELLLTSGDALETFRLYSGMCNFLAMRDAIRKVAENLAIALKE